jgi:hypothetical protein
VLTCGLLPAPQRYAQHPPQQQQQQPLRLSVDEFERAMELLETAHFDAVKAWWDKEQAGECMLLPPAAPQRPITHCCHGPIRNAKSS